MLLLHGGALRVSDRRTIQYLAIFLRHCTRAGFYTTDSSNFSDQVHQNLFHSMLSKPNHVLQRLLSRVSDGSQNYSLRPRAHERLLSYRGTDFN